MLFSHVDLWKHIAIVTQPDQRIGRRGSELSICKSHPQLFHLYVIEIHSAIETTRRESKHSRAYYAKLQGRVSAMEGK